MDLLTPEESPSWWQLLGAVVAAFVLATAVGFVVDLDDDESTRRGGRRDRRQNPRFQADEPDIKQAPWKLVAFASATPGKATAKQKKAVKEVAPKVKNAVRDLYDALTVSRGELKKVSTELMPAKARNNLRGRPLVPFSLSRIKTVKREAQIAIDPITRASAAAKVRLSLRADQGKKRLFVSHEGTLWLERDEDGWQIIAFNLDQRANA